jgi:hypothetical protein
MRFATALEFWHWRSGYAFIIYAFWHIFFLAISTTKIFISGSGFLGVQNLTILFLAT